MFVLFNYISWSGHNNDIEQKYFLLIWDSCTISLMISILSLFNKIHVLFNEILKKNIVLKEVR